MKRFLALLAPALVVGAIAAGPAQAADPTTEQTLVWQFVCEAVNGEVSPQPALVCTHQGLPIWNDDVPGALVVLQRICERGFGGSFTYRSEYPTELAACFFD
jgi:hypothetical protein